MASAPVSRSASGRYGAAGYPLININTASVNKNNANTRRKTVAGKAWAIFAPSGANNTLVMLKPRNAGQ